MKGIVVLTFTALFTFISFAENVPSKEGQELNHQLALMRNQISRLEQSVSKLEAEVEIIREQSEMLIRRTIVGYRDATYLKGGFSLLLPRSLTFDTRTDTGLGLSVGLGKYFGEPHVFEGSLDWDVYPAVSLRYRYEFHGESSRVSFGPVIGAKMKLFNIRPFDNFLIDPDKVDGSFWITGFVVGLPIGRSLVNAEGSLWWQKQQILTLNLSFHHFL